MINKTKIKADIRALSPQLPATSVDAIAEEVFEELKKMWVNISRKDSDRETLSPIKSIGQH